MKIFVINLKRSVERRKFMERQLKNLNLEFEFIEGVDGKNFSPEEYNQYKKGLQSGIHSMIPGFFGSAWAHIKVYEKIIDYNLPHALVLEDDVKISSNIKSIISEDWVKSGDWEFVHLGYNSVNLKQFINWLRASWFRIKKQPLFALYVLVKLPYMTAIYFFEYIREKVRAQHKPAPVRFFRPLYLGRGYLVSLSGAKKLMELAYPIRYDGDQLFNKARIKKGLRFYGYCPPPISSSGVFGSEIK